MQITDDPVQDSVKSQIINTLGFVGHTNCHNYSTLPLQCETRRRCDVHELEWLCANTTLLQKQAVVQTWPTTSPTILKMRKPTPREVTQLQKAQDGTITTRTWVA